MDAWKGGRAERAEGADGRKGRPEGRTVEGAGRRADTTIQRLPLILILNEKIEYFDENNNCETSQVITVP